jgi:hypothetical protein
MLKYIRGLVLCLVVLIGVAYVPPTYAASATVVITHIQAGGVGAALEEIVVLYNNSSEAIDVSEWCVKNKGDISFACFIKHPTKRVYLPAYSYATIGSHSLATTLGFYDFSIMYEPTNQSSGSIVGGSDTISLIDDRGFVVDSHDWTTSIVGGMVFARQLSPISPLTYQDTNDSSDWKIESFTSIPNSQISLRIADPDVCPNIDGSQTEIPEGLEVGNDGLCQEPLLPLKITEILPNASGSDVGKEFIELYNPNERAVDLSRYELLVGPHFEHSFRFPAGTSVEGFSYAVFTNALIPFSLLNSSSRVQLLGDGGVVDETPEYQDPDDDMSWALIEGVWQYTNILTPGLENSVSGLIVNSDSKPESSTTLKSCNENQYRSTETNRCRNIETATTKVQNPCKDGQYRSEETNRCRNIASASEAPAPCKEGQERSPETNRCRNIKAMPNVDYEVLGATTSNQKDQVYIWLAIAGIVLLAIAYAVWEWRFELTKIFRKLVSFVRIRK